MTATFDQAGHGSPFGGSMEEEEFLSTSWTSSFTSPADGESDQEMADDPEVTQAAAQNDDFAAGDFPGNASTAAQRDEYDPWADAFATGAPAATVSRLAAKYGSGA